MKKDKTEQAIREKVAREIEAGPWWIGAGSARDYAAAIARGTGERFRCPRRQCRGRLPHSGLVHWFGWVRR